jgi:predicted phage terminase large subunit-like protein
MKRKRTIKPKKLVNDKRARMSEALLNLRAVQKEKNNRRFFNFFVYFWPEYSNEPLDINWHIPFLCDEVQTVAERIAARKRKEYDLIINIPPGTTKTSIVSIMFVIWCWTKYHWMRFITASYVDKLSLESAEYAKDILKSDRFREMYPEIEMKPDKESKQNYKVQKRVFNANKRMAQILHGGNRYSTSVGGSMTGFHAHIPIVDDPIDPQGTDSAAELETVNKWMDETLSSRLVDKRISTTILIMQRLHQIDPSGYWLKSKKRKIRHICIPAEIVNYRDLVRPKSLIDMYSEDGLMDVVRMPWDVLHETKVRLGQYGYSGQMGQNPIPAEGGMFQVDKFGYLNMEPTEDIEDVVRYWDKAGTSEIEAKKGTAFTCGVKIIKLKTGFFVVADVVRGRWASNVRENKIKQTADADHIIPTNQRKPRTFIEQEPGSGGKESAENTVRNLAGYRIERDLPKGDKTRRADPFSVQVNEGNVLLVKAPWNEDFIEEYKFFPNSQHKDQVDAGSGAFSKLTSKKIAKAH